MAEYKSKTVTVDQAPMALFDRFTNFEGMSAAVPPEMRDSLKVDGDSFRIEYGGVVIAVRIKEKAPFSKIVYEDIQAPFHFNVTIDLENGGLITQTLLTITVDADLNFMMKAMLGSRIQEFLDKAVMAIATGQPIGQ